MPLFERYAAVTGIGDPQRLRAALDMVWAVTERGGDDGPRQALEVADSIVVDDSGDWVVEMGYAENAVAVVAYAAECWLTDDPQQPVWAALQVYEAADLAAQQQLADGTDLNSEAVRRDLIASAAVQQALAGIESDLIAVQDASAEDWQELRSRSRREGQEWLQTLS